MSASREDSPPWRSRVTPTSCATIQVLMPGGAAEHGAILVVDDLHTPIDGVFGRNASHLQEVLKRAIVSGQLQCISIATSSGYAKSIVDHGWLEASFQPVSVRPASDSDTTAVLRGIKDIYEKFHGVTYTDEVLTAAIACAHVPFRIATSQARWSTFSTKQAPSPKSAALNNRKKSSKPKNASAGPSTTWRRPSSTTSLVVPVLYRMKSNCSARPCARYVRNTVRSKPHRSRSPSTTSKPLSLAGPAPASTSSERRARSRRPRGLNQLSTGILTPQVPVRSVTLTWERTEWEHKNRRYS